VKTLIAIALFALGVHLALRTVAALYRIIDLWYTIGTAYSRVLRGILGWGGATVAIALLLADEGRSAFLWGVWGFVGFYLSLYVVRYSFLRRREGPLSLAANRDHGIHSRRSAGR